MRGVGFEPTKRYVLELNSSAFDQARLPPHPSESLLPHERTALLETHIEHSCAQTV